MVLICFFLELPVHSDGFVDGKFTLSDFVRGLADLHGQRVFDAEDFRAEGAFCRNVAKGSVDRVEGHRLRRGHKTLGRRHLIEFLVANQEPHELVRHIQVVALLVHGKFHGSGVHEIPALLGHGNS